MGYIEDLLAQESPLFGEGSDYGGDDYGYSDYGYDYYGDYEEEDPEEEAKRARRKRVRKLTSKTRIIPKYLRDYQKEVEELPTASEAFEEGMEGAAEAFGGKALESVGETLKIADKLTLGLTPLGDVGESWRAKGEKIYQEADTHPIAKAFAGGAGALAGQLPTFGAIGKAVSMSTKIPQAWKSAYTMAAHGALGGLAEDDLESAVKRSVTGAATGAAMGSVTRALSGMENQFWRVMAEEVGQGGVQYVQKAIAEGEMPSFTEFITDPNVIAGTHLGVLMGAYHADNARKIKDAADVAKREVGEAKIKPVVEETPVPKPGEEVVPLPEIIPPPKGTDVADRYKKVSKYYKNTLKKELSEEAYKNLTEEEYLYLVQKNEDQWNEAIKSVGEDLDGTVKYLVNKENWAESGGYDNAKAIMAKKVLYERGNKEGVRLLSKIAQEQMSRSGQFIQSNVLAERLSPGEIYQTALRIEENAKKRLGEEKFTKMVARKLKKIGDDELFPPRFVDELMDRAREVEKLPESRVKDQEQMKLLTSITDRLPKTRLEKLSAYQTMAQLLNIKTYLRNKVGNMGFAALDSYTQNLFGTRIDEWVARNTKMRSVGKFERKAYKKGKREGATKSKEDIEDGIDTTAAELARMLGPGGERILKTLGIKGGVQTQYDLKVGTFDKGTLSRKAEDLLAKLLRVDDRRYFYGTMRASLAEQMKLAKVKNPTQEMMVNAISEGLYKTYQDVNKTTKAFVDLKRILNFGKDWGLGDLVLKYPKTPANLLMRGLDYSPIGLMRGFHGIKKLGSLAETGGLTASKQRQEVMRLARGMSGSALMLSGALLNSLGLLTAGRDEEKKMGKLKEATGERKYSLNLYGLGRFLASGLNPSAAMFQTGDRYSSLDWFQPLSNSIFMGAELADRIKKGDGGPMEIADILFTSVEAGMRSLTDQPLVTGISTLFKRGDLVEGLANVAKHAPSSFVPTLLSQARYALDPKRRDVYQGDFFGDMSRIILNKLPGASKLMPSRKNILGKDMEITSGWGKMVDVFSVFASPSIVNKFAASPGVKHLYELYEQTGGTKHIPRDYSRTKYISHKRKKISLDSEQRQLYQEVVGRRIEDRLNLLVANERFLSLPPDKQVEIIFKELNRVGRWGRNNVLRTIFSQQ